MNQPEILLVPEIHEGAKLLDLAARDGAGDLLGVPPTGEGGTRLANPPAPGRNANNLSRPDP